MAVFHFSENGAITRFEPRAPLAHPETPPHVWAIDEWHSPLYFLPSDCPRVAYWPLPTTTADDLQKFWGQAMGRVVIAVEVAWFERIRSARLYRYVFDEGPFIDTGDHGVFVSPRAVEPIAVEPLDDLPARILEAGVEMRVCPSLVSLAKTVMRTSLHGSLIRMRNAQGWDLPGGSPTLPPS